MIAGRLRDAADQRRRKRPGSPRPTSESLQLKDAFLPRACRVGSASRSWGSRPRRRAGPAAVALPNHHSAADEALMLIHLERALTLTVSHLSVTGSSTCSPVFCSSMTITSVIGRPSNGRAVGGRPRSTAENISERVAGWRRRTSAGPLSRSVSARSHRTGAGRSPLR